MQPITCAFIGLGLIGGSIAKAIRSHHPNSIIYASDIDVSSLNLAKQEGIINDTITSYEDGKLKECDYLFLCAPVLENDKLILNIKDHIGSKTILTDVGSVKQGIHKRINELGLTHCFIGGHPMAGSEKTGYAFSNERLIENAYYILTPTEDVPKEKVNSFQEFVTSLGAIAMLLTPSDHDYVTAAVSHIPHLISAELVNLVKKHDLPDETMKMIAAGGFKDITRISSSSPTMWKQITFMNDKHILGLLDSYIESLELLRNQIIENEEDKVLNMFSDAKDYRETFSDLSSGPIRMVYRTYVNIPDEAGIIGKIASLLASYDISLKNIGIIHNREFEEGVLRIEFYDKPSLLLAKKILSGNGYD